MKERRHSSKNVSAAAPFRRPKKQRSKGFFSGIVLGPKFAAACTVLTAMSIILIIFTLRQRKHEVTPSAITPLPVPRITGLPQFQGNYRERFYWGTYRPQLYLGIRARTPKSLLAGLMWTGPSYKLRHTCEESDGLAKYGWVRHNGQNYGRQEIVDRDVSITTSFLKNFDERSGYGGDWVVRLNAEGKSNEIDVEDSNKVVSFFFYVADEEGLPVLKKANSRAFAGGHRRDFGEWEIHSKSKKNLHVNFAGFRTDDMHNLTQLVERSLQLQARASAGWFLNNVVEESSNVAVYQITGQTPLKIDFVFVSGLAERATPVEQTIAALSEEMLDKRLAVEEKSFNERFETNFRLGEKFSSSEGEKSVEVARVGLSNLIGGIGYFFGQSEIAIPHEHMKVKGEDYWFYWPAPLYTAVPCRSFFPRGFLWDEGFHQLIISKWDRNISYDIIAHWLNLINIDGWIPREQILGAEARSKVPSEFIQQHTDNANPPTLFLVFHEIVTSFKGESTEKSFLERSFPRLEAWFKWFNTTQAGRNHTAYYWHGRDAHTDVELNAKSFSSGLDDYPRASHPSDDERHVDLRCWMALASKTMALIAKTIGAPHERYQVMAEELSDFDLLSKLHYDAKAGRFYDYGNHTHKVKLEKKNVFDERTGYIHTLTRRLVYGQPKLQFVQHFGYVSLFPFISKIIPKDSDVLGKQLELIRDEKLLWTSFGLRSLSTTSSMYNKYNTEHDPPYWRGTVWINFNYLLLSSLRHYSKESSIHNATASQLYEELRSNLLRNMVQRYYEGGYLYEQYDNMKEGQGKGARPFTGWTSLLLLIMAELY